MPLRWFVRVGAGICVGWQFDSFDPTQAWIRLETSCPLLWHL